MRRALAQWFDRSARDLPWRRTRDPYRILVSEFMLQQTRVATVIPYYERWLARFPTLSALAAAPEEEVLHTWQGLGYYSRARNLHRCAQALDGVLPRDVAALRALPGVGRYTAGAVATFAWNDPEPIVDANIARVLSRLIDIREPVDSARGAASLWRAAKELQPRRNAGQFNAALMELGALICTSRAPQCGQCPIARWCTADDPAALPKKRPRTRTVRTAEDCAYVRRGKRVLLSQETGRRWRGLWRLPLLKRQQTSVPVSELSYSFTHHRVHLRVFETRAAEIAQTAQWHDTDALERLAMPAPHRRALEAAMGNSLRRPGPAHTVTRP
jgi:A/G-specific adenine glycosylase